MLLYIYFYCIARELHGLCVSHFLLILFFPSHNGFCHRLSSSSSSFLSFFCTQTNASMMLQPAGAYFSVDDSRFFDGSCCFLDRRRLASDLFACSVSTSVTVSAFRSVRCFRSATLQILFICSSPLSAAILTHWTVRLLRWRSRLPTTSGHQRLSRSFRGRRFFRAEIPGVGVRCHSQQRRLLDFRGPNFKGCFTGPDALTDALTEAISRDILIVKISRYFASC